jgi:hypothetical protein
MNGAILLDSLNQCKFIIYNWTRFISGNLTGDNITFGPQKELHRFKYPKLVGNKLVGFRETDRQNDAGIPLWQYCTVDLDTLTEQAVDVPMILGDDHLNSNNFVSF